MIPNRALSCIPIKCCFVRQCHIMPLFSFSFWVFLSLIQHATLFLQFVLFWSLLSSFPLCHPKIMQKYSIIRNFSHSQQPKLSVYLQGFLSFQLLFYAIFYCLVFSLFLLLHFCFTILIVCPIRIILIRDILVSVLLHVSVFIQVIWAGWWWQICSHRGTRFF